MKRFLMLSMTAAACAAAFATPASAMVRTVGLGGWQVQSSVRVHASGAAASRAGIATRSWLHVKPDAAGAVGTEVGALVQTGHCPRVFFSTRMRSCFGYQTGVGAESIRAFAVPWWFRTTFVLRKGGQAQLVVNGVVGEADLWVDGHEVATRATVQGAYTRYVFDLDRVAHPGVNTVAFKVYPNDPNSMFTLDNVDWTQVPPDNNTGIQFPVGLHVSGALALNDAHVVEHNSPGVTSSALTLKGVVTNRSGRRRLGLVVGTVTPPGGTPIRVNQVVGLPAHSSRTVVFAPAHNPRLRIAHPQVWWPYAMGAQPLYKLRMSVSGRGQPADAENQTFGIRTITSRLVGPSPLAPHGSRQFLVNGRPFVFRGGGWSEDLFLRYSRADTANQIAMIKNLGLNGIRTEGKQMPDDFYEQMDRAGIMIDAGYQCCDAWQLPGSGKGVTRHDYAVLENSARTIGENLRNHPSVINFSWSDNNPISRQEAVSLRGFRQADFQDPLIASAEYKRGVKLGWSGEKEGPYDWVPPSYWYSSKYSKGDSSRTNVGGAWAFDSEASAGHTIPTLDSIKRFLSPFEQRQLWKSPNYNQYHANYEPGLPGPSNGGYSFGTLHDIDRAIAARYGKWSSLGSYVEEAQLQNYETQRAEFEAYIDHSKRKRAPSTGIVYWQLNKGWPTLLWDLYNHDLDQAGSYFGAQEANLPLHVLYAYDTGTVTVDNLGPTAASGLSVESKVYNTAGKLLDHKTAAGVSVGSQGVVGGILRPRVPAASKRASTYFVELLLRRGGTVVDRNVYWLSTRPDVVDWQRTIGQPQAYMKRFADLRQLHQLARATVSVTAATHAAPGLGGADTVTDVRITNTSSKPAAAFFLRADVRRGSASGRPASGDNEVLPVFWSTNDTTLWPGESETLHASYRRSALHGAHPVVSVSGWNVAGRDVRAG